MKQEWKNGRRFILKITAIMNLITEISLLVICIHMFSYIGWLIPNSHNSPTSNDVEGVREILSMIKSRIFPMFAIWLLIVSTVMWLCSLKSKSE